MYHEKTTNRLFVTITTIIFLFSLFAYYDICLRHPLTLKEGTISDIYVIPRHEIYDNETDSLNIIPLKYYIAIMNIIDNDTITHEDIEISREKYLKVEFGYRVMLK